MNEDKKYQLSSMDKKVKKNGNRDNRKSKSERPPRNS